MERKQQLGNGYWILVVALGLPGAVLSQQGDMPPARVEVATAEVRELAPMIEVSGGVISLNDARIATEVEGVLTWVAEVGSAVDAGQVLARIDPRLLDVALKRAQANVDRLEADLRYRERQLERAEDLAETRNASATLLDESRATRDVARQQLVEARALLELAQSNRERSEIRAPFAGHVTQRLASVGEYLGVGEDVIRLVDTHRLEIALPAPIALTDHLRPGMTVEVRNGGRPRRHRIKTVVPVGDAVSRMVEVRLAVEKGDWLVGTPVQVSLPSDAPVTAVAVPRDALVERGGVAYVYRVGSDGTAEQIEARIAATVGLWVALSTGVQAGDRVVVRGGERLAPGQAVVVIDEPASP